jgi:tetratricopeptide (TPR) repeat protein
VPRQVAAPRRLALAFLGLALLALALRFVHERELTRNDILARAPAGDEATFVESARRTALGQDDRVPYQAPLYPLLLGGLARAVGVERDWLSLARLLQGLAGVGTAALAAGLAHRLTGKKRAALVAFALVAFSKPLLHAEGTLLREAPSAALLVALALAHVKAAEGDPALESHAALGLALGLGLVLRENFAVVALAILLERAIVLARAARTSRRAVAAAAVGLALGAALPVLPFDVKNARLGDGVHVLPHWNSGCVFFLGNRRDNGSATGYETPPFVARGNPEAEQEGFRREAERRAGRSLREHEVGAFWLAEGLHEVALDPARFLGRVELRLVTTLVPWETTHQRDPEADALFSVVLRAPLPGAGALLVLAALGAGVLLVDRRSAGDRALAIVLGAWWLSMAAAAFTTRYRVPALPLLAVLGARGLVGVDALLKRGERRKLALPIGLSLATAILTLVVLPPRRTPPDTANSLRTRGLAALSIGESATAARFLDEASRLRDDRDGDVLSFLGESWLRSGKPLRAWAAYTLAWGSSPRHDDIERGLAVASLELGRPREARTYIERARKRAPQDRALADLLARAEAALANGPDAPLPPRASEDPRTVLR